jgi:hypothetical protein
MAETKERPKYGKASDFNVGIGDTLDKIADTEVLLLDCSISQRAMRGEQKGFVSLNIVADVEHWDGNRETGSRLFHAWSDSLAEKLKDIPANAYPVLITFTRVQTAAGFRVWTFE